MASNAGNPFDGIDADEPGIGYDYGSPAVLPDEVLAAGHYPADGLARVDEGDSLAIDTTSDAHGTDIIAWIDDAVEGRFPAPWRELTAHTPDDTRLDLRLEAEPADPSGDVYHWRLTLLIHADTVPVAEVRAIHCDDCDSPTKVGPTVTDRLHSRHCIDCREKWGNYLKTTYTGGDAP